MKKIIAVLLALCIMIPITYLISNAECTRIFENDPIIVSKKVPTIDGIIEADEGWSDTAYLNEDTAGYFYNFMPLTSTVDFNFAYSEQGLYFAGKYTEYHGAYTVRFYDESGHTSYHRSFIDEKADTYNYENYPRIASDGTVIESALVPPQYDKITVEGAKNAFWIGYSGNTVEYSTGIDNLNNQDYGWNGDVVSLSIDLLGKFNAAGLFGGTDYSQQYNVGVFEGNQVKVALSRTGNEDITSECKAAGSIQDNVMTFEIMIPWERIVKDANESALFFGVDHEFTVDEVTASGAVHRASVTLMDRFFDPEAGSVQTWGKFCTVCERCDDGLPGFTVGPPIKGFGLKLFMTDNKYTDLPDGKWYTKACLLCSNLGYMTGVAEDTFSPETKVTRAQFVQILAKTAGADLSKYDNKKSFSDVPTGKWYSCAVEWAFAKGIAGGTGGGNFSPNGYVTRQQLCTFMRAYAIFKGQSVSYGADITSYSDYADVADWAKDAVSWAVGKGIITGTSVITLSPKSKAVGKGIITGTSVITLSPKSNATRGQVAVIIAAYNN